MKIYSWNMFFLNAEKDRAFAFISESDFDIFCLQEVPEDFLKRLQTLSHNIAFHVDVERVFSKGIEKNYVVVLSKHPITEHAAIPFPDYWPLMPLRAHVFLRLMEPFGISKNINRGGIYADIAIPTLPQPLRVFSLHLTLSQPKWRLKEFETVMRNRDVSQPTIVCGDFNILEALHITILDWIFGGPISDAVLFRRERANIQRLFAEYQFINALQGKCTHALSRSQLDHILVSSPFIVKKAEVVRDKTGSDHHPVLAEIDTAQLDHI